MSGKPEQKVLRIGIIQAGKIIEERLLRKRGKVTVGLSAKNTFVLPMGEVQTHVLFDVAGDSYELVFSEEMDGRVAAAGGEVLDFAALRRRNLATQQGGGWHLPLTDASRGKIILGDVTVLFQFVVPPPVPAAPQLPAVARGGWVKTIDWVYTGIVLAIATLEFGTVGYMRTLDIKKEPPKLENLDARFAKLLAPELQKAPEPEKKSATADKGASKDEKKDEGEKKPKKAAKTDDDSKTAKRSDKREDDKPAPVDRAAVSQKVAKIGILGAFSNAAAGGDKTIADVFSEGKVDSDIDTTFKRADAVAVANAGDAAGRGRAAKGGEDEGVGSTQTVSDDKIGGGGTGRRLKKVAVAAPEKREVPMVAKIGGGKLDIEQGELEDPGAITAVIKRRIGAIKGCYDAALKQNPDIRGKVVVKFTIGETGAVVEISVEENTSGDDSIGSCIVSRVRNFRFPKPRNGRVTVSYPFILTASKG